MTETQEARETAAVYAEQVRLGVVLSRENLARFIESQAVRLAEAEEALGRIGGTDPDGLDGHHYVGDEKDAAGCPGCIARAYFAASRKEQSEGNAWEQVYIFNTYDAHPVYHDYGRIVNLDIARTGGVTKCGLVLYDGQDRYRALLRRDHADLFAKPCGKCFAARKEQSK